MARYKYYEYERKDGVKEITVVSSYAGKPVKGKATCAPEDEFNRAVGRKLARCRCDEKVDYKRVKRALEEKNFLLELRNEVDRLLEKNKSYLNDSLDQLEKDRAELFDLLEELE